MRSFKYATFSLFLHKQTTTANKKQMANYKALSQQVQSGTILSSDQFTTVMSEAAALFKAGSRCKH